MQSTVSYEQNLAEEDLFWCSLSTQELGEQLHCVELVGIGAYYLRVANREMSPITVGPAADVAEQLKLAQQKADEDSKTLQSWLEKETFFSSDKAKNIADSVTVALSLRPENMNVGYQQTEGNLKLAEQISHNAALASLLSELNERGVDFENGISTEWRLAYEKLQRGNPAIRLIRRLKSILSGNKQD